MKNDKEKQLYKIKEIMNLCKILNKTLENYMDYGQTTTHVRALGGFIEARAIELHSDMSKGMTWPRILRGFR